MEQHSFGLKKEHVDELERQAGRSTCLRLLSQAREFLLQRGLLLSDGSHRLLPLLLILLQQLTVLLQRLQFAVA